MIVDPSLRWGIAACKTFSARYRVAVGSCAYFANVEERMDVGCERIVPLLRGERREVGVRILRSVVQNTK